MILRALLLALFVSAGGYGQSYTPLFELKSTSTAVPVGGQVFVELHVSGVLGATTGYQVEVLHDPAKVAPASITQGAYLPFGLFIPGTSFADKIRIGALNFPSPTPIAPGSGGGILAVVVYDVLAPGPIHLDLTSFTLLVDSSAMSIASARRDLLVTGMAQGDILSATGVPNPGGSITLTTNLPGYPGAVVTAAASSGNSGIPVPGFGVVPLTWDALVNAALADAPPYTNAINVVPFSGSVSTQIAIPPLPSLVGLRVYFASVAIDPSGIIISNGLYGDVLAN